MEGLGYRSSEKLAIRRSYVRVYVQVLTGLITAGKVHELCQSPLFAIEVKKELEIVSTYPGPYTLVPDTLFLNDGEVGVA